MGYKKVQVGFSVGGSKLGHNWLLTNPGITILNCGVPFMNLFREGDDIGVEKGSLKILSDTERKPRMLEALHSIGSRVRHSRLFEGQGWLWERIEPHWQKAFERLSRRRGFSARINEDEFRLVYAVASRYSGHGFRRYEATFYQAFTQRIERGMTVFDIGAHVGLFTLAAAKRVGPEGRVYAFEPSPQTAEILKHHIRLNGWQDRAEVVPAVVCDVDGVVPFYTHGFTMAASVGRENVEVLNPEMLDGPVLKIELPSVTLDGFCEERNIKPNVVKIDVEGAELLALRGARNLLLNERFSILCEIHPRHMRYCGSALPELDEYLAGFGYYLKPLDEPNELGIFHGLVGRQAEEGIRRG